MNKWRGTQQNIFGYRAVTLMSKLGFWLTGDIEIDEQGKAETEPDSIDLLGIRFDQMFTPTRVVADFRDRESKSDSERLLRLRGLGEYLSADTLFFIRPKVHKNCRALASRLNIRVLDDDALTQMEINQVPTKLAEHRVYQYLVLDAKAKDIAESAVRTGIRQLEKYLSYGFWSVDFYRNLFILIEMYRSRREIFDSNIPLCIEFAFRGAERFALCLLEMARSVVSRNPDNLRKLSRNYLHGGSLALRDKEKFFSLLRELTGTHEQVDPPWLDEQLELLARMLFHPIGASDVLRHISAMRTLHLDNVTGLKRNGASVRHSGLTRISNRKGKQSDSVIILPERTDRDVQLILPFGGQGVNSDSGFYERVADPEDLFGNIDATILAKHLAFTFCRITGINPRIFSSISDY